MEAAALSVHCHMIWAYPTLAYNGGGGDSKAGHA